MTKLPIKRALINGKRRFAIYAADLADLLPTHDINCRKEISWLLPDLTNTGKLRHNIDWTYNTKRQDIALTLSSTQIILATIANQIMAKQATAHQTNKEQPNTAQIHNDLKIVWDVIHQITDFIQGIKP